MSGQCKECDGSLKARTYLPCNGICGAFFHFKCAKLSEYDAKLINEKPAVLCMCNVCRDYVSIMFEKVGMLANAIQENKQHLEKQNTNIEKILYNVNKLSEEKEIVLSEEKKACSSSSENQNASIEQILHNVNKLSAEKEIVLSEVRKVCKIEKKISYAESVRRDQPVMIKPRKAQENKKTKEDLNEKIDPSSLAVRVNKVVDKRDRAILISCDDDSSRKIIEKEVKEKLGSEYDVLVPNLQNPCVKICGINEKWSEEGLLSAIKKQNNIECELKCLKMYSVEKDSKKSYSAIISIETEGYRNIIERKRINLGWNSCVVYDFISVKRCYKCWGYNHNAKDCRNEVRCAKCGDNHDAKNCKSELLKCNNCVLANSRLGLSLSVNHDCRSGECEVYKKKVEIQKNKTSF